MTERRQMQARDKFVAVEISKKRMLRKFLLFFNRAGAATIGERAGEKGS